MRTGSLSTLTVSFSRSYSAWLTRTAAGFPLRVTTISSSRFSTPVTSSGRRAFTVDMAESGHRAPPGVRDQKSGHRKDIRNATGVVNQRPSSATLTGPARLSSPRRRPSGAARPSMWDGCATDRGDRRGGDGARGVSPYRRRWVNSRRRRWPTRGVARRGSAGPYLGPCSPSSISALRARRHRANEADGPLSSL